MTQYTIMATTKEADDILNGRKTVIFRNDKLHYKIGDSITFNVIKGGKNVRHSIDNKKYEVIFVGDYNTSPIQNGWLVINFRRVV